MHIVTMATMIRPLSSRIARHFGSMPSLSLFTVRDAVSGNGFVAGVTVSGRAVMREEEATSQSIGEEVFNGPTRGWFVESETQFQDIRNQRVTTINLVGSNID